MESNVSSRADFNRVTNERRSVRRLTLKQRGDSVVLLRLGETREVGKSDARNGDAPGAMRGAAYEADELRWEVVGRLTVFVRTISGVAEEDER